MTLYAALSTQHAAPAFAEATAGKPQAARGTRHPARS
jgi:hypothetical protein